MNKHMLQDIQSDDAKGNRSTHWSRESVAITERPWRAIVVQLRALGLVAVASKKRTVSDGAVYEKLAEAGDDYLL